MRWIVGIPPTVESQPPFPFLPSPFPPTSRTPHPGPPPNTPPPQPKTQEEEEKETNSPTKSRRISRPHSIPPRSPLHPIVPTPMMILTANAQVTQPRGRQQRSRLDHVRTPAALHPHGHAGDGLLAAVSSFLFLVILSLLGASITVFLLLLLLLLWLMVIVKDGAAAAAAAPSRRTRGLGLAGVELAADGEEFGAVAPGGEDVLYHILGMH